MSKVNESRAERIFKAMENIVKEEIELEIKAGRLQGNAEELTKELFESEYDPMYAAQNLSEEIDTSIDYFIENRDEE